MVAKPLRLGRRLVLAALLLLASAPGAWARTLVWQQVSVAADLDAEGRLRIVEEQTMVFDGEWNGGERVFTVPPGQRVVLERLARLGAEGKEIELQKGDLDQVDQYDWIDGSTLRWRSRLPADPPFDNTTITYRLTYNVAPVLVQQGESYLLDYNFGMPQRPGGIAVFNLRLRLDPVWDAQGELAESYQEFSLAPGVGMPLKADLAYLGEGSPSLAFARQPLSLRLAVAAALLAAMALLYRQWWRHEAERGRFEQTEIPARLEPQWLEEHVFDLLPEEVGTLWDRKVGAPEVAAVLARMVGEGKLSSEVRTKGRLWNRRVLSLRLEQGRGGLGGYELELVDKLFFARRTEVDTDALRKHYRKKGLDLAAVIRPRINARLTGHPNIERPRPAPPSRLPWQMLAAFVVLLVAEFFIRGGATVGLLLLLAVSAVPLALGFVFAHRCRHLARPPAWASLGWVLSGLLAAVVCFTPLLADALFDPPLHLFPSLVGLLAVACWILAWWGFWISQARTRDVRSTVARRHLLGAVRERFAVELGKPEPALEDAWFPYLLALGLDRRADAWFTKFGGATTSSAGGFSGGASVGSTGGSSSWSGGGGAFGGAGATVGWAAAATGMAAGVSQASSGSSGGGSSFSGGGGGGGW